MAEVTTKSISVDDDDYTQRAIRQMAVCLKMSVKELCKQVDEGTPERRKQFQAMVAGRIMTLSMGDYYT